MKWFRLYDELVDDPKMILLPADVFRNVIFLWCVASQNDGYLPPVEAVAVKLRLPVAKTRKLLADLKSRGLLDQDADGRLYPHNWGKRQFKTDAADPTNNERQKRYRNGSRNGPVTDDRNGKRNAKDRYGGVTGKRPESESESESESDSGENHQHPPETVAAPARGQSLVSPEAIRIADELGQNAGFTKENWPLRWCGAAMAIQKWLNDGCPGEVIKLAVNIALSRKRDSPPDNFSYFSKPIAAAFADYLRPNPTVPPQAFDGKSNGNATRKRTTIIDAADDLIAEVDARIAAAEAREAGERESETSAWLLPPGGCDRS